MRLCEAEFGLLSTCDGDQIRTGSTGGVPPAFAEFRKNNPPVYGPETGPARILAGERVVHIVDLKSGDAYRTGDPNRRAVVDLGGAGSACWFRYSRTSPFSATSRSIAKKFDLTRISRSLSCKPLPIKP